LILVCGIWIVAALNTTGDKTLLKEVQMGKGGRITYGDGSQSKVIGKGIIDIPRHGASQEALYVEGLKANFLASANSVTAVASGL
jgi:hypothetical protein